VAYFFRATLNTLDGMESLSARVLRHRVLQTPVSSGSVLEVVLGDWVYVGIQLFSRDASLKLVLEQCYASPSATPNTSPIYFLIRDKSVQSKLKLPQVSSNRVWL